MHLLDVHPAEPLELAREVRPAVFDRARPDLRRDERTRRAGPRAPCAATPPRRRTSARSRRAACPPRTRRRRRAPASSASPPKVFHVPSPTTGPSRRSSISGRAPAPPARPRRRRRRSRGPRPARGPCARAAGPRRPPASPRRPAATTGSPRTSASTASVWCETPRWRFRSSAPEARTAMTGTPPSASAALAASAAASPPCPKRVPVPTIPGPIAQTATSCSGARPGERRSDRRALDVRVEAGRNRRASPPRARARAASRTVSESETGSAPPGELDVGDAQPAERRADRRELAVQRAADDRQPAQLRVRLARLLDVEPRVLQRRVRQHHHVRALLGRELEAARQVRVEDVEPARAELELARLDVDEHLVVELDRAGQRRVGDAGDAVHLQPDELLVALMDRRDLPAAQAKRHRPRRRPAPASHRPSRAGRRRRSARRACGCRSSRSRG